MASGATGTGGIRFTAVLAVLLLTALCLPSCSKEKKARPRPPAPVTCAPAALRDVPMVLKTIGRAEASATVSISAQVDGVLQAVHFKAGDFLAKGQPLFNIDARAYAAELKQALAKLAGHRAQLKEAQMQAKRYTTLVRRGAVGREPAEEKLVKAADLAASVALDQAAVEAARLKVAYCSIVAPMAGRSGNILVDPGNLVKAMGGQALVVIKRITPIQVHFSLPQAHVGELRRRMAAGPVPVAVRGSGIEGRVSGGRLVFIDNAVDTKTGTIALKARFPNPDKKLWPGQFLRVAVTLHVDKGALTVPARAIQRGPKGYYVYLVDAGNRARMVPVDPLRLAGKLVLIKGKVKPGDKVVTSGHLLIAPGAKVAIKQEAPSRQVAK